MVTNDVEGTNDANLALGRNEAALIADLPPALPLSAAQSGIWYAIKAGTPASAYNIAEYTRIHGPIDKAIFEAALRQLIREVEALRIRVFERNGVVRQIVGESPGWRLDYFDLTHEADPLNAAEAWMRADVGQPVNLDEGRLFGFALFKTDPSEFLWYFRAHHLIMDAYCGALITKRLAEIYSALSAGLDIQVKQMGSLRALVDEDVAYRASVGFESDRVFWRDALKDCPEPPRLSPRSAPMTERQLHLTDDLSPATLARLYEFARRAELTFPQVITLASVILVHRLTEAEDLVLGQFMLARMSPIGRATPAMARNIVPLRFSVRSDMPVAELAGQVRRGSRAALRRQRYPIIDIRRDVRRVDRPLVLQMISVRPFESAAQFAGARSTNHPVRNGPVEDLNIQAVYDDSTQGACRIEFEANPDLYDAEDLERLQRRYLQVLSALDDVHELVGRLDILPSEERQLILKRCNRTRADYARGSRVNELLQAQAHRTPNRVAASFGGRRLTYRELDERASLLAGHLSALGVVPDDRVALHVERSLDMLVALLGILKAGASYVPLDPGYPAERLEFILADSRPRVLLTEQRLRDRLQPGGAEVLLMDALPPAQRKSAPSPRFGDIACVIYTSGSTGKPKGVQVQHQAIVNFLCAMRREPGIMSDDRLLAITSLSFDIAALELFLPLIAGAQVIIAAADVANDGRRLAALLQSSGATIMQATPSTWRMLVAAGWEGSARLKILCGGEAWPVELAGALLSRCSSLWNMYGPTETTIWSAAARIMGGQPVLIGPPIANTTFYVLDPDGQIVPLGVPGELYIGGDGVTRGYLNRPELTSERFLPDLFSERIDARLYRTGDRVRQLSNGRFEFLGRLDFQVKVRGFRIELGEIEAILRTQPSVQDAVAVALDGEAGGKRIVAFATPKGNADLRAGALTEYLRQKAPAYMTPAAVILLEAFPLTPNGKVDRKALALRKDLAQPASDAAFVAPCTPLEKLVAGLWCDCLRIKEVGLHDNFFELGGNSLSMVHLSLDIERATGVSFPMSLIFDSPTVFEIAKALAVARPAGGYNPVVLLRPGGVGMPVFMVPSMFGSASEVMPIVSEFPGRMSIYGLQARGLDGVDPPFDSVEEMAQFYVDEITALQPRGPYFLVGKCFGGLVAMEMARRLSDRGEHIGLLALLDAFPHPRLWPLHLRIAYFGLRAARNVTGALRALPLRSLPDYLARRVVIAPRRFARFMGEGQAFLDPPEKLPPRAKAVFYAAAEAQVRYNPRYYPGKVDFLMCGFDMHVPNAHSAIWPKWVGECEEDSLPTAYIKPGGRRDEHIASWLFDGIQRGLCQSSSDPEGGLLPTGATERASTP